MKKETIINALIKHGIPEKLSKKYASRFKCDEDIEDFCQEMYLIMLETIEKHTEKMEKLYDEGKIYDYFARICINQIINQKSKFNRDYETQITKVEMLDEYDEDTE